MTLGLLLMLNAAPADSAPAPEHDPVVDSADCHGGKSRQLRGHTFLFPILQKSSFVTTHVGIREGIARYDVPDLPIGRLGTSDVLLEGLQQTIDLGFGITDWLGLDGFAQGVVIVGGNGRSLVINGGETNLNGEVGPVIRLWHSDTSGTQISVRANFSYTKTHEITVFPFVSAIVNNPLLTIEDVVNGNLDELIRVPSKETAVNGGAYLAQAFSRTFSLQASANGEYGWDTREPFDTTTNLRLSQKTHSARVNVFAALAADFAPHGIPVAVMGEYLFTVGRQTYVDLPDQTLSASSVALGVYYSGRTNLQLGLGAATTIHAARRRGLGPAGETLESGNPNLKYGQLILRYIW